MARLTGAARSFTVCKIPYPYQLKSAHLVIKFSFKTNPCDNAYAFKIVRQQPF
jgi:hypothetical protein